MTVYVEQQNTYISRDCNLTQITNDAWNFYYWNNFILEAFEVSSIWAIANGFADDIPVEKNLQFESEYHAYVKTHDKKLVETLSNGQKITAEAAEQLKKVTTAFKKIFS